jgi:hypothetical protein
MLKEKLGAIKTKILKINAIYPLILFLLFMFQRMDSLVCVPLLNSHPDNMMLGYQAQVSWWAFMSITIILVAIMMYASNPTNQGKWYAGLLGLLYAAGFLDIMYIFEIPFVDIWINVNFVHFWNIFYIAFGYPWTIKEQVVWWICWGVGIYIIYKYLSIRHGIKLMLVK